MRARRKIMHANAGKSTFAPLTEKTIFRFDVKLISGPITSSFMRQHPKLPSRIIDIYGFHTLEDLHLAIFKAFDRDDHHMFEFQIGGKKPHDRKSQRYVLHIFEDEFNDDDDGEMGDVSATIISLHLVPKQSFFYWFDFGDDWWHKITFIATPEKIARARYPKIVDKIGKSPPQYVDWDEEDDVVVDLENKF
jgi:hypothetical protein